MMRRLLMVLTALALLSGGALAAPTCKDRNGGTIKCGTQGAMPVGWSLPPELLDRPIPGTAEPDPRMLAETLLVIALLFALIALLPEFDGRHGRDWGSHDGDDEDGR